MYSSILILNLLNPNIYFFHFLFFHKKLKIHVTKIEMSLVFC